MASAGVLSRLASRAFRGRFARQTGTLPRRLSPPQNESSSVEEERAAARRERDEKEPKMTPSGPRAYEIIGSEREDRKRVIFGTHGNPASWVWGHNPSEEYAVDSGAAEQSSRDSKTEEKFAIMLSGSHQFKVSVGDVIYLEKVPGDVNSFVTFPKILLVGSRKWTAIGRPLVTGAAVVGRVEEQTLLAKSYKFVFRKRKKSKRTTGHRQHATRVRISEIEYQTPRDEDLVLLARRREGQESDVGRRWRTALSTDDR